MISKIARNRADGQRNKQFFQLADYLAGLDPSTIAAIDQGLSKEKATYIGTRNLVSSPDEFNLTNRDELKKQVSLLAEEMNNTASKNNLAEKPCIHAVLSWPAGERPTIAQVEEAIDCLNKNMNLEENQCIYAAHENTDYFHIHVQWNKVHPKTHKSINPNHGWTKKATEKTARELELKQGWKRQEGTLFTIIDGEVVDVKAAQKSKENITISASEKPQKSLKKTKITGLSRQIEAHTGIISPQRFTEEVLAMAEKATSWKTFQDELKKLGGEVKRKGSGVVFWFNGTEYKASSISKRLSRSKLEERFGSIEAFEKNGKETGAMTNAVSPKPKKKSLGQQYKEAKESFYKQKRTMSLNLSKECAKERKELFEKHRNERNGLYKVSWRGRGKELNLIRSVLAWRQAKEQAELKQKQKNKRKKFSCSWQPFPSIRDWSTGAGIGVTEDLTAFAPREAMLSAPLSSFTQGIFGYQPTKVAGGTGFVSTSAPQKVSIVDSGNHIRTKEEDEDTVLAVLQLAQAKWGKCEIHGSATYIQTCLKLAVEHGIKIVNPELQEQIEALKNERKESMYDVRKKQKDSDSGDRGERRADNREGRNIGRDAEREVNPVVTINEKTETKPETQPSKELNKMSDEKTLGTVENLRENNEVKVESTEEKVQENIKETAESEVKAPEKTDEEKVKENREQFAAQAVALLERGKAPWQQPMTADKVPVNALTGRQYRGMNLVMLATYSEADGLGNRWMTVSQKRQSKSCIKEGEKSHRVEFWKRETEPNGDENFKCTTYAIFNADQMIKAPEAPKMKEPLTLEQQQEKVNRLLADSKVNVQKGVGERPYWDQKTDTLYLSKDANPSMTMDELCKATRHPQRNNRVDKAKWYPAEEALIVAMTQMFVAAETGIPQSQEALDEQAKYVKKWQKDYTEKPDRLAHVVTAASVATTNILRQERERDRAAEQAEILKGEQASGTVQKEPETQPEVKKEPEIELGISNFIRGDRGIALKDADILKISDNYTAVKKGNDTYVYTNEQLKPAGEIKEGDRVNLSWPESSSFAIAIKATSQKLAR